jgi:hypothetical protein
MEDKLREEMEGGERDERFSVHFNVHIPLQTVILNNLKILGPLQKMKPCTMRGHEIGN